jgi:superfamily II helicase
VAEITGEMCHNHKLCQICGDDMKDTYFVRTLHKYGKYRGNYICVRCGSEIGKISDEYRYKEKA